jgi:hypothetical protein
MEPSIAHSLAVSAETAGLGNRIKSWVSAMRLGSEVRVHWTVRDNMPAEFSDLFAGDWGIVNVPSGAIVYKSWRLVILPEDEPHLPVGFATVGAGAHPAIRALGKAWWTLRGRRDDRYRYMLFPKQHSRRSARADARHIDLEYGRIPSYFRELYVPLFRRITPREEIAARVDGWSAEHLDERVIGVQVRTWRDDPRRERKYYQPARKRLARLLNDAGRDERFLVVSDSDAAVAELRDAYGRDRVLAYPRATSREQSWRSVDGITDDLIDLLLLARCGRLYASYLSTFSEAAWWLGGATASVAVF